MSRTKVSVLIPVHNGEGYIGKAIRSILGQSFHDLEVVVLDDGSSDRSARVSRAFGDSRVRVYRREEHEGVAQTRNHLLMVARAPLIAFLDADDVALGERIAKQAAFLDRHRDYGLVTCSYFQIDTQGQTLRRRALPQDHDALSRRLLHGNAMPASTVLVRKDALEAAGGFDTSLGLAAEYDAFLKVAEKARIGAISEPLVKCRVHSRAASYERRHEVREGIDEALRRAVRRRFRKTLAITRKADDAQPFLFAPTGEPAPAAPAGIQLVAAEPALPAVVPAPALAEATALSTASAADALTASSETAVPSAEAPAASSPSVAETVPPASVDVPSPIEEEVASSGSAMATVAVAAVPAETALPVATALPAGSDGPQQLVLGEVAAAPETAATAPATDVAAEAIEATPVTAAAEATGTAVTEPAATTEAPAEGTPEVVTIAASVVAPPPPPPEAPTDREVMVAVVIDATGRAALAAVKSVLDQTLTDIVVAVVATKHDEGLACGLELIGDERVLLLECDGGNRARAFNLGILATRSRYVAYLGENGVFRPEHLDKLVQAAETDRLGLVYSDVGLATAGIPGTLVTGRDFDGEHLLKENFIPTEAVLHRRDLLHEVGLFNEGLDEGMEWEMWVYLTRVGAARRIPQATVERVVGGPKAARLIAPSPNRVRRYLAEKFSKGASPEALSAPSEPQPVEGDGVGVARAQERIRRGDWAGAAAEIVDAASRQLTALSQLFSPRYPEREVPLAEMPHRLIGEHAPALVARPRASAAEPAEAESTSSLTERTMPADILPHRLQAAAGPMPMAAASPAHAPATFGALGTEPDPVAYEDARPSGSDSAFDAGDPEAAQESDSAKPKAWMYLNGRIVPRQRQSPFGAARPGAARPATSRSAASARPAAHAPLQGKRRKPIEAVTEHPSCPLCGSGGTTLAYRAGWYRVLDCSTCNLGFSFPRIEPSRAVRFFSDRRPEIVPPHIKTAQDCLGSRYDRSREIGWARKYVREGRLADVGCSWGYGMAQAAALGFDPFGTELSRVLARTARERFGFEVKERDFPDLDLEAGALDVVLAVHVMQHFVDPRRFVAEAFRALRPGGVMVGSLPNFDAYLREELGRRWKWLDPECQPYHFRPASLRSSLEAAGFETEIWTSEGLYGEDALLDLVTPPEAADLARTGRGSEIGFVALKR